MTVNRRTLLVAGAGIVAADFVARVAVPFRALAAAKPLRVASVKFGSLAWLIETIKAEKLDEKHGVRLDVVETATNQSSPVALYGGSADVVVTDWPWALRQRAMGEKIKFAPFSGALGAIVVPPDSPIKTLGDLKGKKLGVAGSSTDKSWLLLRAHSNTALGGDIADMVTPQYGAAPLLNEQLKAGRLDAILNFWTFAARLEAAGYRRVMGMDEVMQALGIDPQPAMVGYIWKESAAADGLQPAIDAFLAAAKDGNDLLLTSDAPWERLRALMRAADDREFKALIAAYRSGIRGYWSAADMASAEKIMGHLVAGGDTELVGNGTRFDPELFYAPGA